jgi:hypothetical protein
MLSSNPSTGKKKKSCKAFLNEIKEDTNTWNDIVYSWTGRCGFTRVFTLLKAMTHCHCRVFLVEVENVFLKLVFNYRKP